MNRNEFLKEVVKQNCTPIIIKGPVVRENKSGYDDTALGYFVVFKQTDEKKIKKFGGWLFLSEVEKQKENELNENEIE